MPDMTVAMAREIVRQGIINDAFAGDPDKLSEAELFKEATDLVTLARQAYDKGILAPAVIEILFAAQIEPPAENPAYYDKVKEIHSQRNGDQATAPAATPAPAETDAAPTTGGEVDINSIIPDYDDLKVKDIVEKMKGLSPEQVALVKAHEAKDGERKGVLNFEPPLPPAPVAQSVPPSDSGSPDDLKSLYDSGQLGQQRAAQSALRLPDPPTPDAQQVTLPVDITGISNQDLSRYSMLFHSLEAHTLWLASQEEGRRDVAEHLAKDSESAAFGFAFGRLKAGATSASAVENARSEAKHEAERDESVRTWKSRAMRHAAEARTLNALAAGYEKAAVRLSREQTSREKLRATPTGT